MADFDTSEKSRLLQPSGPPPYQDHSQYPNAGYPPSVSYPSTSSYQAQQFGAPASLYYPEHPAIAVQPTVYVTNVELANPPPDYLGYSFFTMLCCCLPLGIAALVHSYYTRDAYMSGNRQAAENSSRMAFILNNVSLGIGITMIIICIIVFSVNTHKSHTYP